MRADISTIATISATSCRSGSTSASGSISSCPIRDETNDNRFDQNSGFSTADDFARYLIDCFDLLYEEGAERPRS